MNIQELILDGFTKHKHTHLKFPATGVVVVAGDNGAGKSSIAEGPCVGYWGETLRGTLPWSGDGYVTVISDRLTATRERKGSRTKLSWNLPGEPAVEFETTTKAQEALENVVGSFALWRRSRVFSSQDASHFTLATDAERKRLLESLLGLDRFDGALGACKAEYKAASTDEQRARNMADAAKAALATLCARIQDADESLKGVDEVPADFDEAAAKAKAAKAQRFADDVKKELDEVQVLLREADRGDGKREAQLEALSRRLQRLKGKTACDQCGQLIEAHLHERLKDEVSREQRAVEAGKEKATATLKGFEAQLDDLRADFARFQRQATDLNLQLTSVASLRRQRAQQEALLAKLRPEATKATLSADDAAARAVAAKAVTDELESCVQVLGLKGVRAHVLGKALGGLETVANGWLARIAGAGLTLSLKPYTEKKTGGTSESISLEVTGAGGGHGYRASSGGERRRIDVSILLALAEVAQAAHGTSKGTLFLDECMDSLDGDGIERVSEVLNELAKDRCVVVITHNPALASKLTPVQRWTVDAGSVRVV